MGRCPNEAVRARLWKPRVGIQGEDEADPVGNRGRLSINGYEGGVRGASEKPVQLAELSSLPFPADPLAFLLVPETATMQQEETAPCAGWALVLLVEAPDAVRQRGEEVLVVGQVLAGRVGPVAQEGEVEMALGV